MYGLLISEAWSQYYASSPFLNLLNLKHPRFEVIPMNEATVASDDFWQYVKKFDGIVVDDVWISATMKYPRFEAIPLLMIDGDPHRHRPDDIEDLSKKYRWSDYVLTGGVFAKKHPRYFYPQDELRKSRFVYYPHAAPSGEPPRFDWNCRSDRLLVSGSISQDVYPYRVLASKVESANVLPFQTQNHMNYFHEVSKHKAALACQSVLEYTVAKYFEIPWCGTALVAQPLVHDEAEILGLRSMENCYLFAHPGDISGIDRAEMREVAKAGHELIMKRHTVDSRGDYLAALIDKIIAGGFEPEDAFDIFKSIPERNL